MYSGQTHGNTSKPLPSDPMGNRRLPGPESHVNDGPYPLFRAASTNPFDFPRRPSSPSAPPVPPRPRQQAASPPPVPPPPPPHAMYDNSGRPNQQPRHAYDVPELRRPPTNQDSYFSPQVLHAHVVANQSHRYYVPELTVRNYDPNPPPSSSSSSTSSNWTPQPFPAEAPPAYHNNPWSYPPPEPERGLGQGLGMPEGVARPRAKSTFERPSSRPYTESTFTAPTISFPEPQIPAMPSLGRASSATASLSTSAKSSPTDNGIVGRSGNDNGRSSSNSNRSPSSAPATTAATPSGSTSNGRRPSSGRGGGRGEFRFSPNLIKLQHMPSVASFQSTTSVASNNSYSRNQDAYENGFVSPTTELLQFDDEIVNGFAKELSNLSLDMNENVLRFQKGELPEADQEWHRLVPEEALKALDGAETKRQGLIFELLKAEREYVADLETMEEVFIRGLTESSPSIIPEPRMSSFVDDVFGNLHEILVHHRRMLDALFERQRDTHPLIHSVADILLETSLKPEFRNAYEKYIKHYPLSDSIHQKELQSNRAYANFLQSVSGEPRIKKRDLKIFLSRPLTRLVRMNMLVEQIHKRTNKDHGHPDVDTLPIILNIISDSIKATQPGIEAAEQKVKFWDLCEKIIMQKGELLDMDLLDKERHLVHMGSVLIRTRSETGFTSDKWTDLTAHLLDNYFLLTSDKRFANGVVKKVVVFRPLPLSFIRLASFTAAPETRREKIEDGGILDTFRSQTVTLYPFTLYHASPTSMKAYTLYVTSDSQRKKWYSSFVDTLSIHKVRQEGNQWFSQEQLVDGFFRIVPREGATSATARPTGKITCAVPFATLKGERFIAIGCASGVYVAPHNKPNEMVHIFSHPSPSYMAALQSHGNKVFNKFILHVDTRVISYSLELLVKMATGQVEPEVLESSKEYVTGPEQNVLFVRHVNMQERVLLVYASKKRMSSSVNIHAAEALAASIQRTTASAPSSFRQFGQPGYIPKEAYDIVALAKTITVCVRGGVVIATPGDFANTAAAPIPILIDASSNPAVGLLKSKIENARPLGLLKRSTDEFLIIYDDGGCYMNSKGIPIRNHGFVKWETKAVSYAHRDGLILLISPRFIEIRDLAHARLVQVIEGGDIRLLYSEPAVTPHDNIILAMRGRHNDHLGLSEKIVELVKTVELGSSNEAVPTSVWSEWDM